MIRPLPLPRLRSVNRPALLALTGAGLFLASLDAYVVVTVLVRMLTSVHIPLLPASNLERGTPIITGFLLGYLAVMPLAGGLSDRVGRLRIFVACLLLFSIGSLVTASAGSLSSLVIGRTLQGAGGGALVPVVLALAADLYPREERSPILGVVSALQEVGSVLGPLWGGLVAGLWGWNWIFWLNLPAAALLIWAVWPGIRRFKEIRQETRLDWLGALFAGAGLAFLTLALYAQDPTNWPLSKAVWWQLPVAILFLGLFVRHERRAVRPLVRVGLFKDASFAGGAIASAIAGAGLIVALVFIPVLAQSDIFRMGPRESALLLFRFMLGIPIGALVGGWLAQAIRSYRGVAAVGLAVSAAGFAWLSGWDEGALRAHVFGLPLLLAHLQLFVTGFGLGLEIAPVNAAVLDLVGHAEHGATASFLVIMRLVGMLVGFSALAGFGIYHFQQATRHLFPPVPGVSPDFQIRMSQYLVQLRHAILDEYHFIFVATAVLLMAGALAAAATLRPLPRRSHT